MYGCLIPGLRLPHIRHRGRRQLLARQYGLRDSLLPPTSLKFRFQRPDQNCFQGRERESDQIWWDLYRISRLNLVNLSFKTRKNAPTSEKFAMNILSGGCAGSLSLLFVQSIGDLKRKPRVEIHHVDTLTRGPFDTLTI